ncbi:S8 family serine peptidase [Modestobacter sp. SYSU DS0290]
MDHQRADERVVRRPDAPPRRRTGRRLLAAAAAAVLGFGGAAAIDHLALADGIEPLADFGPDGDGLSRLVVTAAGRPVDDTELAALQARPGVVSAQRIFDGSVLVATEGLSPADLEGVVADGAVEPSATATVFGTITDPFWAQYGWNLENTGSNAYGQPAVAGADVAAPAGWAAGTGRGLVVAVTDTGLMAGHPDLAGALWTNPDQACNAPDTDGNGLAGDCHGWNFYGANADYTNAGNDNSHGTGVSGLAGARAGNGQGSAGVAPDVTIMPLVIGAGGSVDVTAGAAAIVYAVDQGADVINASWGGPGLSPALAKAIDYANAHGVPVVAAAGNDAGDRDVTPVYPANYRAPNVVTVGNSTAADTVSSSSAYGATTVDLFAPGHYVLTTSNTGGYNVISGTSASAPQVAAALALYRAHLPTASAADLKARLLGDTRTVPAFVGKSVSGGRLSLAALGTTVEDVRYSFTGMRTTPGTVAPQVVVDGSTPAGAYSVRFGLGLEHQGEVMAVAGHPVDLGGTVAATDDSGEVAFDLGTRASAGPQVLSPSTELGAGRYVLTVQLYRDGTPAGRRFAAPLLVATAAATPPSAAPTSSAPTSAAPTSAAPSNGPTQPTAAPTSGSTVAPSPGATAAPTSSGSGGSGGASPTSSASASPTATPTGQAPAPTAPQVTSSPTSSAAAAPTSGGSGTAAPTSTGSSSVPTGTAGPTGTSTAPPPASSPTSSASAPSSPADGGSKEYPPTGPFGLTSISPAQVGTAGGTSVTITGSAIPDGALVVVGGSRSATVTRVSATELVFTAPALAAGTYDVTVFASDRTTSATLTAALTAVDAGSGEASPTKTGSTPTSTATPTSNAARPTEVTGPNGMRLVRSSVLASLAPRIWQVNCSSACSGMAV